MFQSTIAADLAGDMMAALARQKYINIETQPADAPGMVRITAEFSEIAKGTGRMPTMTVAKERAALDSLHADQETAERNAALRCPFGAGQCGEPWEDCDGCPVTEPTPAGDGYIDPRAPATIPPQWDPAPSPPAEATAAPDAPALSLARYSRKAFIIRGNTKDHRDRIKAVGWTRFNFRAKEGAGWIVAARDVDLFRDALADLL